MTDLPLKFIVRNPTQPPSGRPPLLLLLHGIGSNEQDLMGLAPALDGRFLILSLRAPLTLQPGSYAWYPTQFTPTGFIIDEAIADQSRQLLLSFIPKAVEQFNADPQRVFLMGFSQGCIMSVAAGLTAPRTFAGIVGMSGRLLPSVLEKAAPPEQLRGLPVLVTHGTADSVIRIEYAREMRKELEARGVALTYIEYPMAHNVSQESLADISGWLKQRLDAKTDWRSSAEP